VRDRNGNLAGDVKVMVVSGSNAFVATSAASYINGSTDRNFEISNANGLSAGSYKVYAAVKVGSDYVPVSPSITVNVTALNDACTRVTESCTQWWQIEFKQN